MKELLSPVAAVVSHEISVLTHLEEWLAKQPGDGELGKEVISQITERAGACVKIVSDFNLEWTREKVRMLLHCIALEISGVEEIRNRMREVRETMIQELSSVNFLRSTDDMETYLDKSVPFGTAVSEAFPNTIEDIAEAHQCFALERYTATAFHICRVMEKIVKKVASKMGATATRDEWQNYINAMNDVINKMPYKNLRQKEKRSLYSATSNYLFNFKEAFRNKTMHPKRTYTRDEALSVINSSREFLDYVARNFFKRRVKKT